jgi:hypothetical protein
VTNFDTLAGSDGSAGFPAKRFIFFSVSFVLLILRLHGLVQYHQVHCFAAWRAICSLAAATT